MSKPRGRLLSDAEGMGKGSRTSRRVAEGLPKIPKLCRSNTEADLRRPNFKTFISVQEGRRMVAEHSEDIPKTCRSIWILTFNPSAS